MPTPTFLMSPPDLGWKPRAKANPFSQSAKIQIPKGQAHQEWEKLATGIREAGGNILECPAVPSLTGLPYTAEAGLYFSGDRGPEFWLANVTPEHRKGEAAILDAFLKRHSIHVHRIESFWEGQGDCFRIEGPLRWVHTYGVGRWARTEPAAFEELKRALPGQHFSLGFHADPWFHGNTFLAFYHPADSAKPSLGVVAKAALLDGGFESLRAFLPDMSWLEISAAETLRYATNALQVQNTILHLPNPPKALMHAWKDLGLGLREIDLPSLFTSGGGGPVCLTNAWKDFPS